MAPHRGTKSHIRPPPAQNEPTPPSCLPAFVVPTPPPYNHNPLFTGAPMPLRRSLIALILALPVAAQTLTIPADRPGAAISPTFNGIFFEDINFGADGGLYPERVKNRSFEFDNPLMAWSTVKRPNAAGYVTIQTDRPLNANNPHYLRLIVAEP